LTKELSKPHALIELKAGPNVSAAALTLQTEMRKACEGRRALRLVKEWPSWVVKTTRLTLSGGPKLKVEEECSKHAGRAKIIYSFDSHTEALRLEAVDNFNDEKPADSGAPGLHSGLFI